MFSPIKSIPEVSTNSEGSTPTAPCASPFRGATPFMCSTPSPLHFKDPLVRERIGLGSQPTKGVFSLSKKDQIHKYTRSLHDLIRDMQHSRSKIIKGVPSDELSQKISKLEMKIQEYQKSIEELHKFFHFGKPEDAIEAVSHQISLASALIDPPLKKKECKEKNFQEQEEGRLLTQKGSFLHMALASLKQNLEILKAYERAKELEYPVGDLIKMPDGQEKASNLYRFTESKYLYRELLGQGSWGQVRKCSLGKKDYAIKTPTCPDRDKKYNNVHDREILVPLILNGHKNVMKVCAVVDGNPVLELMRGGSLEEYLQKQNSFSDSDLVKVLAEIASGLAHMHENGLIHKDLKPANILLKSRGEPHPVIIDFGSTVPEDADENRDVVGTELYMAPEMAARLYGKSKKGFDMRMTSKMDIWALGLIIYEMASEGSHLFVEKEVSQKNLLERKQPFDLKFLHDARDERLKKMKKMASLNQACLLREGRQNPVLIEGLFSIAADCLKMQSIERPSAAEVEKRLLDLQTKL